MRQREGRGRAPCVEENHHRVAIAARFDVLHIVRCQDLFQRVGPEGVLPQQLHIRDALVFHGRRPRAAAAKEAAGLVVVDRLPDGRLVAANIIGAWQGACTAVSGAPEARGSASVSAVNEG